MGKSSKKTIQAEADAADRALWKMVSDPKLRGQRHRRYVLLERAPGRLEFRQDEIAEMFDEVFAEVFGLPKPRRRVIRLWLRG